MRGDYSISELRSMLAGEEPKKEAVPAAEAESGRDSGTEKKTALTQAKRTGQALSPDKSTEDADDRVRRGEDGKFKSSKEDGEASKEDKPEHEDGPQKRINKAVAKQREAERRAAELEKQIEELKQGKTEQPKKTEPKKDAPKELKKPEAKDFDSYDDYIDALTDYKADLRDRQREERDQQRRQAEANEAHKTKWAKKVDATRAKYGDYDDVMEEAGGTPISQAMHNAIAESDIGPELGYYLATHLDEAAEIAKLTPTKAIAAMARIEDKLTAEPDKKPAEDKKPKAEKKELPKPARNVGGSATPKGEPKLDDPDTSFEEFKRIAHAQLSRR